MSAPLTPEEYGDLLAALAGPEAAKVNRLLDEIIALKARGERAESHALRAEAVAHELQHQLDQARELHRALLDAHLAGDTLMFPLRRLSQALGLPGAAPLPGPADLLPLPVSTLVLSVRAAKAVARAGAGTIGQLVALKPCALLQEKNCGAVTVEEIQRRLTERGLAMAECPGCSWCSVAARDLRDRDRRNRTAEPRPENATHCAVCGHPLPADRLAVAREEEATGTSRGHAMAARLRSDRCLPCSEKSAPRGVDGALCRPEGQRVGNGRVSS